MIKYMLQIKYLLEMLNYLNKLIIFYVKIFRMIPISPPKMLVSKSSSVVSPATTSSKDDTLERNILSMSSMDLPTAIQSMNAIENVCIYCFQLIYQTRFRDFQKMCSFFKYSSIVFLKFTFYEHNQNC